MKNQWKLWRFAGNMGHDRESVRIALWEIPQGKSTETAEESLSFHKLSITERERRCKVFFILVNAEQVRAAWTYHSNLSVLLIIWVSPFSNYNAARIRQIKVFKQGQLLWFDFWRDKTLYSSAPFRQYPLYRIAQRIKNKFWNPVYPFGTFL